MLESTEYWVKKDSHFDDIQNEKHVVVFDWKKNIADEYIKMAESFREAAYEITYSIACDLRDHAKTDQWFFPAMYLYRQSIELLCKGLLLCFKEKSECIKILNDNRHNIFSIFCMLSDKYGDLGLRPEESAWLRGYLEELERLDANSNLFRYPIKDGVLREYNNKFLDVINIANGLERCYCLMHKCLPSIYHGGDDNDDIDLEMDTKVIYFASNGICNCMLYESRWETGYYAHIKGYSEVALKLLEKSEISKWSFYTIALLLRHSIELVLKNMLFSRTEYCVDDKIKDSVCRSHSIYKKLWKSIKPMIEYYVSRHGYDGSQILIAEAYIVELDSIDKSGYMFRYPTNLDLVHDFKFKQLDFYHSIHWLMELFNFLDGTSGMLDVSYDYECEIRSYYP